MSARSVWSGTRPSRYHSVRLISAPPRRPEHLHPDAEGPGLLGVLHGPLHGPAEGDAVGQLVGDALGDQGGVELGLLDLLDVQLHLGVAGDLGEPGAQLVGLGAAATDDDARPGGVDVDPHPVTGALDLDAADGRLREQLHDVVADLPVLGEVVDVLLVGEPAALPVGGDAEPEAVRIDLLTHQASLFSSSGFSSSGVSSSVSSPARRRLVVVGVVVGARRPSSSVVGCRRASSTSRRRRRRGVLGRLVDLGQVGVELGGFGRVELVDRARLVEPSRRSLVGVSAAARRRRRPGGCGRRARGGRRLRRRHRVRPDGRPAGALPRGPGAARARARSCGRRPP